MMSKNITLLLIEKDGADQGCSFTAYLRRHKTDHRITSTTSLAEAKNQLKSQSFDVILLDDNLCNDSSCTIQEISQYAPVLLIAESSDEDTHLNMILQGIDDILYRDKDGENCEHLFFMIEKTLARREYIQHLKEQLTAQNEPFKRLTASLAHDLSNVISPILGFSKIVLDETVKNDPHFEMLEEVHKSAVRAKELIRQLSTFKERDSIKLQPLNLGKVLQNFHTSLKNTLSEEVALEIGTMPPMPPILGDIALIEQAVMQLCLYLQEAIHYSGKVRLSVHQATSETGKKQNRGNTATSSLVLKAEASESAKGVKLDKTKVLQNNQNEGSTVGQDSGNPKIYWVKAIIKQHDGSIRVGRNENNIEIELSFPVSDEITLHATQPDGIIVPQECCGAILLVENNLPEKKIISAVLQQKGYNVHIVDNEEDAFSTVSQDQIKVDLLLADTAIIDPEDNRVFTCLMKHNKAAKAFYMVSPDQKHGAEDAPRINTEQVIYKPFALNQLTKRLRKILDG